MSFGDDVKMLEELLQAVEKKRVRERDKVFCCPMCSQPASRKDINWKVRHP